ncbi:PKD domain-containing protein [Chondrinema litorale]|uniref:PKD domain-containing protein n=1 Tax=Chondrinema litorale TaxID=2994555 RepID=UPI002543E685|nr:PKD domain-containing protein [Chondrinema litorale]UZR98999.1 PKD domain-containing protein [Chondrinema litorale]
MEPENDETMNRFVIICLLFLLYSCEDRWNEVLVENLPPDIGFIIDGETKNLSGVRYTYLVDSLKIGLKSAEQSFTFEVVVEDDNDSFELEYFTPENNKIEVVKLENKTFQLTYWPEKIGENLVKITAIDDLGESSSILLNLKVFENLLPIASFTFSRKGTIRSGHYEFDGSSSYDLDSEYGGRVIMYQFEIDGIQIQSDKPYVEFIFQDAGQYEIKLKVQDNDGDWGEEIRKLVEVNF